MRSFKVLGGMFVLVLGLAGCGVTRAPGNTSTSAPGNTSASAPGNTSTSRVDVSEPIINAMIAKIHSPDMVRSGKQLLFKGVPERITCPGGLEQAPGYREICSIEHPAADAMWVVVRVSAGSPPTTEAVVVEPGGMVDGDGCSPAWVREALTRAGGSPKCR